MNAKYDRLSQDIKMVVGDVIADKIDELDYVSVVDVELTKDIGDVKIYVTCMLDNSEEYVLKTLAKKEGFFKKELAKRVKIRRIPSIIFKYDHSLDNYNRIDQLLNGKK